MTPKEARRLQERLSVRVLSGSFPTRVPCVIQHKDDQAHTLHFHDFETREDAEAWMREVSGHEGEQRG